MHASFFLIISWISFFISIFIKDIDFKIMALLSVEGFKQS